MNDNPDSIQSMGGKARDKALTDEQKTEIAKKAAAARWNYPRATHTGTLKIGDAEMECHVLKDGTRLLSRIGLIRAMGRKGKAKGGRAYDDEFGLPVFLTAKNLNQFITNDIRENSAPMRFIPVGGGAVSIGYRADVLADICSIFIDAHLAGVTTRMQDHIVAQCRILYKGFAKTGITALVDEATGYQKDRAKDALSKILEAFISKELRAWTKTFPLEFYEQIFRLKQWKLDPENMKRPSVIGHYTNNIVYKRLAPGVLDELRKKNPAVDGRRKHKMFQWLTGEIGHPKLRSHIDGVLALMRVSDTWDQFLSMVKRAYPIVETTELGFHVEVSE